MVDPVHRHVLRQRSLGLPLRPGGLRRHGLSGVSARLADRPRLVLDRAALRRVRERPSAAAPVPAALGVGADRSGGARCRSLRRNDGVHRRRGGAPGAAVARARVAGAPRLRLRRADLLGRTGRSRARPRGAARAVRRPIAADPAHDDPRAAADRLRRRPRHRGHRAHHAADADRRHVRADRGGRTVTARCRTRRRGDPAVRERPQARSAMGVGLDARLCDLEHPHRCAARRGRRDRAGRPQRCAGHGSRRLRRDRRALAAPPRLPGRGAARVPRATQVACSANSPRRRWPRSRRRCTGRAGARCPG